MIMMPNKAAVGSKYAAHAEATVEEQATILTEESPVVSGKLYSLVAPSHHSKKSLADRIAWVFTAFVLFIISAASPSSVWVLFPSARTTCEIAVASRVWRLSRYVKIKRKRKQRVIMPTLTSAATTGKECLSGGVVLCTCASSDI